MGRMTPAEIVERLRLRALGDLSGQEHLFTAAADLIERQAAEMSEMYRVAAEQGSKILRLNLALTIARAWGLASDGWDWTAAIAIRKWADSDRSRPIPWINCPFFEEWATRQGLSNVDGHVGYRFTVTLSGEEESRG